MWRTACASFFLHARSLPFIALVVYLLVGGVIFSAIESPHEESLHIKEEVNNKPKQIIETLALDLANISSAIGKLLANATISASFTDPNNPSQIFINFTRNTINCPCNNNGNAGLHKWNFDGALFFSLTVVTTVGYGKLAPITSIGKLICVLYAIFGIPLFAIVLGHTQHLLMVSTVYFVKKIANIGKLEPASNTEIAEAKAKWTVIVALLLGYLIFIVIGPSALFTYLEGWDYLSSLYYNFITLTTIGFGDMVAGINHGSSQVNYNGDWQHLAYRLFVVLWLFVGLPFASTLLEMWRLKMERVFQLIIAPCCPSQMGETAAKIAASSDPEKPSATTLSETNFGNTTTCSMECFGRKLTIRRNISF